MLHTVKTVLDFGGSASQSKAMIKLAVSLITASMSKEKSWMTVRPEIGEALAKDMGGHWASMEVNGVLIGQVQHSMSGADVRNIKADLNAALESEEFKALPTKVATPKLAKVVVDAESVSKALMAMPTAEFGRHCETHGIKATIDRGVWSLSIPGVRGTVLYDAQTGERLAIGETGEDKKLTQTGRQAQGKLTNLAFMVEHKGARLTASQKEFVTDCDMAGLTIPAPLLKIIGGAVNMVTEGEVIDPLDIALNN